MATDPVPVFDDAAFERAREDWEDETLVERLEKSAEGWTRRLFERDDIPAHTSLRYVIRLTVHAMRLEDERDARQERARALRPRHAVHTVNEEIWEFVRAAGPGVGTGVYSSLSRHFSTVEEIAASSRHALLALRSMGPKRLEFLEAELERRGLRLEGS